MLLKAKQTTLKYQIINTLDVAEKVGIERVEQKGKSHQQLTKRGQIDECSPVKNGIVFAEALKNLSPATLLKKRLQDKFFPMNFEKFVKTSF